MKIKSFKYIYALVLVLFAGALHGQQPAVDSLNVANQLYSEGKYTEAVTAYEAVIQQGYESPEVLFNLGNAYYKSGNPTYAILNYERARILNPEDEDILYNLELARTHVVDNIEELPEMFLVKWKRNLVNTHTVDEWGYRSMGGFVLFLILLAVYLFSKNIQAKKLAFGFSVLAGIFCIVTFTFASSQKSKINHRNTGIITQRSVTVKGSPSETGTELFILHEGLKVELTDSLATWLEIRLADGNKGWVRDSVLVRI